MRYTINPSAKKGDVRVTTKFLLLPRCINREWRWLEKATYSQRMSTKYCRHHGAVYEYTDWENVDWLETERAE